MCSLGFSIQKTVDDSNLYYFKDKGSIKITSKLEALGRALLDKIPYAVPKENWLKTNYRSEFLQTSFKCCYIPI